MKIAYICADFGVPIFGFKGASIHVREMVAAMCRAGHSVILISPAMHAGSADERGSNMGEERLPGSPDNVTFVDPPAELNWQESAPPVAGEIGKLTCISVLPPENHARFTRELKRLNEFLGRESRLRQEVRNLLYNLTLRDAALEYLREQHIDFIYERYTLFSRAGILMARELGVPHLLEVNAPLAYEQEQMRGLEMKDFAREAERQIFRESDQLLVVSQKLKELAASLGVPEARLQVLPNAVNPQRFAAAAEGEGVRERYRLEGKTVIGFVGSLKPWHGVQSLLEAFRNIYRFRKDVHLLIVGDGPRRQELEDYCNQEGLAGAVTFTGKVQHHDIPHYIAAMDITAAPYTPHPNFYFSPIKIFEYMVMDKPVVGARIGQVEEIIQHRETGLLYEPGNVSQLVAALRSLIDDPETRHTLGQNAGARVREERTWDRNFRQVLEIVLPLLEKQRVGSL